MVLDRFFRDISLGIKRSSQWPRIRKVYLIEHPKCECCGGTKGLEVHHIISLHIDQNRELDITNLITLCEQNRCHLIFGHLGSYLSINENVIEDTKIMNYKIKNRP